MHIGKKHSDQFDCGICDLEIKSLENLKIHLSTCEIYKCDCCGKKVATLKEIKTHMETEHPENKQHLYVIHLKQNRSDCEVIDEKLHNTTELSQNSWENEIWNATKFTTQFIEKFTL